MEGNLFVKSSLILEIVIKQNLLSQIDYDNTGYIRVIKERINEVTEEILRQEVWGLV